MTPTPGPTVVPTVGPTPTPVDNRSAWPEELRTVEATLAESTASSFTDAGVFPTDAAERFSARRREAAGYLLKVDLGDPAPTIQRLRNEARSDLESIAARARAGFDAFEGLVNTSLDAFENRCGRAADEISSATVNLSAAVQSMSWVPDLVRAAARKSLEEASIASRTLSEEVCVPLNDIDAVVPGYTKARDEVLANLALDSGGSAARFLAAFDAETKELLAADREIKERFREAAASVGTPPDIDDPALRSALTSAARESVRVGLEEWYWKNMCEEGGERTPPTENAPCGVRKSPRPAAERARALERLRAQSGGVLSKAWMREFVATEALGNGVPNQAKVLRDGFVAAIQAPFVGRGGPRTREGASLKDALWHIRAGEANAVTAELKGEVLFDSLWHLKADEARVPEPSRRDNQLFDAAWYVRRDTGAQAYSPAEEWKDKVLYDATWYVKRNQERAPDGEKRDASYFDALWHLRMATSDEFRDVAPSVEERQDQTYYDCLGVKRDAAACAPLLGRFQAVGRSAAEKVRGTAQTVGRTFAGHPALPSLRESSAAILEKAKSEVQDAPRADPRAIDQAISNLRALAKGVGAPLEASGAPNPESPWVVRWREVLVERISKL